MVRYPTNNSYVDTETGLAYVLGDLPYQGLASGQTFAYLSRTGQADAAAIARNATNLQLVVLTIEPELQRARELGTYGYAPEARLLCGRASMADVSSGAAHSSRLSLSWIMTMVAIFGISHLA
jgi:hypothetical protein